MMNYSREEMRLANNIIYISKSCTFLLEIVCFEVNLLRKGYHKFLFPCSGKADLS